MRTTTHANNNNNNNNNTCEQQQLHMRTKTTTREQQQRAPNIFRRLRARRRWRSTPGSSLWAICPPWQIWLLLLLLRRRPPPPPLRAAARRTPATAKTTRATAEPPENARMLRRAWRRTKCVSLPLSSLSPRALEAPACVQLFDWPARLVPLAQSNEFVDY
jgi:hypothetical protein